MTHHPADYQRAYRARKRAAGSVAPSGKRTSHGKRGKMLSRFKRGNFVAIDGEGINYGDKQVFTTGSGKDVREYQAADHRYNVLSAYSRRNGFTRIRAGGDNRLTSKECLDFLCDLADDNKGAIFVIFAGGYDVNHWLMFGGVDHDTLALIAAGERVEFKLDGETYAIEHRSRKSVTIRRGLSFVKHSKTGRPTPKWKTRIVIYDVFGFFQESFVGVMGKWLGENHEDYKFIAEMKARRGDFANVAPDLIDKYNDAELTVLVAIMEKLRDAVDALGLQIQRWDGAGSIAQSMMGKHEIQQFKRKTPDTVLTAARTAYAGGRIEACQIGHHNCETHHYDVASAYPDAATGLPCLSCGYWVTGSGAPDVSWRFAMFQLRWKFPVGMPWYPLFFRDDHKQIQFPSEGRGWYWRPEVEAAFQWFKLHGAHIADCELVIEAHHALVQPSECIELHKPFDWVRSYYEMRRSYIRNPSSDWMLGAEKVIKLGINSVYGKMAQQLGGRWDFDKNEFKEPAYHQLAWAGWITSTTRSKLVKAATADPTAVIAFATDGLFTTREITTIKPTTTKELGGWEYERHAWLTLAMSGVYWYDKKGKVQHFSRGFDKESMSTPELVMAAWKRGDATLDVPMHRLIGLSSATSSENLWPQRGRFVTGHRTLDLALASSAKRYPVENIKQLARKLMPTRVRDCIAYTSGLQEISAPYPLRWLEEGEDLLYKQDLELQRENLDTENI